MDVSGTTSESRLIEQFLSALRAMPETLAEWRPEPLVLQGWPADARIDLCVAGNAADLFVEVKKSLYPRDVREILWRLKDLARAAPTRAASRELVPVLVAESISPGAQELLRQERVGYYDSGGSLFLPARGLYVHVDRPPPKRLARSIRSLFSGRRAQVLHALLTNHTNWFGAHGLADVAQVSPATASEVLIALERLEWVTPGGRGPNKRRRLDEPSKLLDAWAEQLTMMRPPAIHRFYVPLIQADELVEKIASILPAHRIDYAITGEAAGQRYAPFLTGLSRVHCRLPISPRSEDALAAVGARAVDEGSNLVLIESRSSGDLLFREQMHGVWLASPVQVYLDLLRNKGRAKELAGHLRAEKLGF